MSEVIHLLCVDDEINILHTIRRQLCDLDVEVHMVLSAEEGLRFLRKSEEQVQVVLSDFRMPGMNGVEFLRNVFQEYPKTIRILLSGYADAAVVKDALEQKKVFAFLEKPWKSADLQQLIVAAVSSYARTVLKEKIE